MEFDATRLYKTDGQPVQSKKLVWKTQWPTTAATWNGAFTGELIVSKAGQPTFKLAAESISSMTLGPDTALIVIAVPSPAPAYQNLATLSLEVFFKVDAWEIEASKQFAKAWFTHHRNQYGGYFNGWMGGEANLPELSDQEFPFGVSGVEIVAGKEQHGADLKLKAGLFVDDAAGAVLVLIPVAGFNRNSTRAPGLLLDALKNTPLGGHNDLGNWVDAPGILYRSLHHSSLTQPDWTALIYWRPESADRNGVHDRLLTSEFLERAWNEPVRLLLGAMRTHRAGQPWLPLPAITAATPYASGTPLLRYAVKGAGRRATRLQQAYLRPLAGQVFHARFDWQSAAILGSPGQAPSIAGSGLMLKLALSDKPEHAVAKWGLAAGDIGPLLNLRRPDESDPALLSQFTFKLLDAVKEAGPTPWLTLGSLELSLLENGKPIDQKNCALRCAIRGHWSAQRRDLYPSMTLTLNCLMRVSAASDPGLDDLDAEQDSANAAEDALHRATAPLRHALKADEGRRCQLTIAYLSLPGRNAVVTMEVASQVNRVPMGSQALYFQARPFIVAQLYPTDIDEQAGTLLAAWRSDDPEGAQWRMPDDSVTLDFPPQAVGEEMERGNRFWPGAASYIDPTKPVRYRFSPPTRIVVQPSVVARRYNKVPNNLTDILAGARVHSFTTEMAYPMQVEFKTSTEHQPDLRIAETASFLGHPAVNLPVASNAPTVREAERWLADVMPPDLAAWAAINVNWPQYQHGYRQLRARHNAARASFAARLGQFHVTDPWNREGGLRLREGLSFRLRDARTHHAAPLLNPLPRPAGGAIPAELLPAQKTAIEAFLKDGNWGQDDTDGALRAGVLHTIEFASELLSILRNPVSETGNIESLAFSALGATGQCSASFDEGRTTFTVDTQHGQVSRMIRVRIGRLGMLWNRAKHIIVYERSTVPSLQFEGEQTDAASHGWPILRKTEEYIEPIDVLRDFASEEQKENNAHGFVQASEFVSRRIYVNSAWGRDLGHGYELPLWNESDQSGFYPKPQLALRMHAGGESRSRCWLDEPAQLYFYSSTEPRAGGDPDRWEPKLGVDCPFGPARLPLLTGVGQQAQDYLERPTMRAPHLGGARRPRFDLATVSDGKVNLQHGRGETEMLAALNVVSLVRSDATDSAQVRYEDIPKLLAASDFSSQCNALAARVRSLLDALPQRLLESGLDCQALQQRLHTEVDAMFSAVITEVTALQLPQAGEVTSAWAQSSYGEFERALGAWELSVVDGVKLVFQQIGDELRLLQDAARQALGAPQATVDAILAAARSRLRTLAGVIDQVLIKAENLLSKEGAKLSAGVDLSAEINALEAAAVALPDDLTPAALGQLHTTVSALRKQLNGLSSAPMLAPLVRRADSVLIQIEQLCSDSATWSGKNSAALKAALLKLVATGSGTLRQILGLAQTNVRNARQAADAALADLRAQHTAWQDKAALLLARLDAATDLSALDAVLSELAGEVARRLSEVQGALVFTLKSQIQHVRSQAQALKQELTGALANFAGSIDGFAAATRSGALVWIEHARGEALALIDDIGGALCHQLDQVRKQLEQGLRKVEQRVREEVTGALGELADGAARQHLASLETMATTAGRGIKLAKAIGDLPALPTLRFNAERAEYLFDDLKQQIETSPFAARLRDIDSGLKELGLAIPVNQLMDQLVPAAWKDMDFSRIIKNLGGISFDDFFKRFKIPPLKSDKIKITHGLDKASRSAWVKAQLSADFPAEQSLFEFSSVAVKVARMQLRANSDMRIGADGQHNAVTDGRFTGDWALEFGGARMATFQDVTVRFDGGGFDFDVSPEKVVLHPSLKFIDEYAKAFSDKLPPAIQIDKDERGMPVGVRANFTTVIDKLPPIPPVTIGPISIASGLGMRMQKSGQFEISTHVSLGSKTAPVFVQIGYLGGGFWLEAQCTAMGNSIVPSASLGLALGSMRSFNLASVARGSYAILLFANAEISQAGGSLRAGMSLEGSARILGVANAMISLLLEVEHNSGSTTARGHLKVAIKICWCYTLRVSKQAEHKI